MLKVHAASSVERVVVLTQACDLANLKTSKVQVAVVRCGGISSLAGISCRQVMATLNPSSTCVISTLSRVSCSMSKFACGIGRRRLRHRSANTSRSTLPRPMAASHYRSYTQRCRNRISIRNLQVWFAALGIKAIGPGSNRFHNNRSDDSPSLPSSGRKQSSSPKGLSRGSGNWTPGLQSVRSCSISARCYAELLANSPPGRLTVKR